MFLHVVGYDQRFSVIDNSFRISMETISRYFRKVLYAIGELRAKLKKAPIGQNPQQDSHETYIVSIFQSEEYFSSCHDMLLLLRITTF